MSSYTTIYLVYGQELNPDLPNDALLIEQGDNLDSVWRNYCGPNNIELTECPLDIYLSGTDGNLGYVIGLKTTMCEADLDGATSLSTGCFTVDVYEHALITNFLVGMDIEPDVKWQLFGVRL